jgi:hypothetical protein
MSDFNVSGDDMTDGLGVGRDASASSCTSSSYDGSLPAPLTLINTVVVSLFWRMLAVLCAGVNVMSILFREKIEDAKLLSVELRSWFLDGVSICAGVPVRLEVVGSGIRED